MSIISESYYEQDHSNLSKEQRELVHTHKSVAHLLPAPAYEFGLQRLIDSVGRSLARRFAEAGLIEKADRRGSKGSYWRTTRDAYAYIEHKVSEPPATTPCGATGVQTLDPDDDQAGWTCSNEACGCRFGRATAREVLDRGD